MSKSQFAVVLSECIVPRAGRLPQDAAFLSNADPMTETLRHLGGQARVDRAAANHIRFLIDAALRGE